MKKLATAAVILIGTPLAAMAAPFCLALPNGSPLCQYVDGAQCQADAVRQNGSCIVNPAEVKVPAYQSGEYCMLLPAGFSRCGYADPNVCARDAIKEHGVCGKGEGAVPPQIPDPYYPNAGR